MKETKENNMLTNDAIVKVRNKPVSNVEQYLDAVELRHYDLYNIWKKHAADTQKIMGPNFVVTLNGLILHFPSLIVTISLWI